MKHRRGMVRCGSGTHRQTLDIRVCAADLKGISFAGNDYDSVRLESGIRSGYRAADQALKI